MKLNLFFWCLILLSLPVQAAEEPLLPSMIGNRDYIVCGTDLSTGALAYKDEYNKWRGFDADLCRNFAAAIIGNEYAFRMKNVPAKNMPNALKTKQIDIMLGNYPMSAKEEISAPVDIIDVLYYDKQMFATRKEINAESMIDFKGSKVCVVDGTLDAEMLDDYNHKYALELKILKFKSETSAKQAFYTNRCELISGSELYLKGVISDMAIADNKIYILPEVINNRPVYAYSAKNRQDIRVKAKWVLNAIKLAEQQGITSQNIDSFIGVRSRSIRNLLGIDKQLWHSFRIYPDWAKKAIKTRGNYGEIFEHNLGQKSKHKILRDKNNIVENKGLISSLPFI